MLGTKIREARTGKGFTQEQLAREIGAGVRSIKRWEKGDGEPSPRYMRRIIRATEKTAEHFYSDDDEEAAQVTASLIEALGLYVRIAMRDNVAKESANV